MLVILDLMVGIIRVLKTRLYGSYTGMQHARNLLRNGRTGGVGQLGTEQVTNVHTFNARAFVVGRSIGTIRNRGHVVTVLWSAIVAGRRGSMKETRHQRRSTSYFAFCLFWTDEKARKLSFGTERGRTVRSNQRGCVRLNLRNYIKIGSIAIRFLARLLYNRKVVTVPGIHSFHTR